MLSNQCLQDLLKKHEKNTDTHKQVKPLVDQLEDLKIKMHTTLKAKNLDVKVYEAITESQEAFVKDCEELTKYILTTLTPEAQKNGFFRITPPTKEILLKDVELLRETLAIASEIVGNPNLLNDGSIQLKIMNHKKKMQDYLDKDIKDGNRRALWTKVGTSLAALLLVAATVALSFALPIVGAAIPAGAMLAIQAGGTVAAATTLIGGGLITLARNKHINARKKQIDLVDQTFTLNTPKLG